MYPGTFPLLYLFIALLFTVQTQPPATHTQIPLFFFFFFFFLLTSVAQEKVEIPQWNGGKAWVNNGQTEEWEHCERQGKDRLCEI